MPQILTSAQCAIVCLQVGFPPDVIPTAVAIAMAESSLDADQDTVDSVDDSHGLWQINIKPDANPEYAGADLHDPITNATIALTLSNGGRNFSPWTTYTSEKYLTYLQTAQEALAAVTITVTVNGTAVAASGYLNTDNHSYGWIRAITNQMGAGVAPGAGGVTVTFRGASSIIPATVANGRSFVALAALRVFEGVTVTYNGATRTVEIAAPAPA